MVIVKVNILSLALVIYWMIKKERTIKMKKTIVTLWILCVILVVLLILVLNTTYKIEINGTTYEQKIFDYIIGRN